MSWIDAVQADGEHATRLRTDLEYFAQNALRIRPKAGTLEPFVFNPAQRKLHELHELLEKQKAETGRVRAIVLKARQLGVSTYVAARKFHRAIHNPGLRVAVVGHERRASSNLFGIVKRFYDHLPEEIRPSIGTSNAEELIFDRLDSGYLVSVATVEGTGRSATAQLLHASEAAFWADLPLQMASLLQVVPDTDGSEVIIETTANGYNDFHTLWRKAEAGDSDFMPVFLPWAIDPDYRRKVDFDFAMDAEEIKLAELHALDKEQIAWRRAKISQLGSAEYFAQEYPITPSEAFISSTFDSFIPAALVIKARKETTEPYGPLIIGVDPASKGPDRTSLAWRQGHVITKVESKRGLDLMETTGWISKIIREEKPAKVNIDVGGLGIGIYDRLLELGHKSSLVNAVNFGGKPVEPAPLGEDGNPAGGYANRRAEMWGNLKAALETGRFRIPDSESLQADLVSCGYKFRSDGKLLLESKDDMRKRGVPSPDEADAVALCFSEPDGSPFPRRNGFDRNINSELEKLYGGLYV
jgi:hypothetical protein